MGDIIGAVHLTAAVASLAAGGLVAVARKGTRYHRRAGWAYVGAMIVVNATALMLFRLTGAITPFHVAAAFSLATLVAGLWPVRRKTPPTIWLWQHANWMAGSYVGLWAAAIAETTTRLHLLPFWWAVAAATALTMVTGMALMARMIPTSITRSR